MKKSRRKMQKIMEKRRAKLLLNMMKQMNKPFCFGYDSVTNTKPEYDPIKIQEALYKLAHIYDLPEKTPKQLWSEYLDKPVAKWGYFPIY